ncbi:PPC domain-containing DNA-binding protein [Halalkalicoccus salilacus]|uniref:PPC domain-containing DNA-binding protein n=1 Tax=Halalkalicoccus TaxID=332246 RepID=UPI002F96E2D0
MHYREVETTREFVASMETGADWREEIESLADEQEIDAGFFYALGAVQDAEFWFYDQRQKEYEPVVFEEPLEVAACVGNVSWLDGERFAHTHAVLSRPSGQALAGHLNSATVFSGECHLREFDTELVRERDETTELDLWL